MQKSISNKTFAEHFVKAWQLCTENKTDFRRYLRDNTLSLNNLDWLFRHEMARQYLENTLSKIDKTRNLVAFGCVSRMIDLFDLDINVNDGGDTDTLFDFTEGCRSLLAEARADLYKNGSAHDISFVPLETYLVDLETGTFGFWPIEPGWGSDDNTASWQH